MQTRYFTLGIAFLLLTGGIGTAHAKTLQIHCKGGGSFADGVETNINTSGEGASAVLGQGGEVCNLGRFVFQEEVEWIQQPAVTTCPVGTTIEFHIDATHGQQRFIRTNEKTGDQLFSKYSAGTFCFNTTALTFTGWGQSLYIGGTGQNANATGTDSFHFDGTYLAAGCKGGCPASGPDASHPFGGFGQDTFTADGTLTLPNGGHDKED